MGSDKRVIQIYQGDCLDVIKDIPNNSIDLTVTSPPYDNLRTYNGISPFTFEKFQAIAKQIYRVTKSGGAVVWIVADATINGSKTGTSYRQALFFKEIGFNLHDTMIWSKGSFSAVGSGAVRYYNTFEYMFVLTKGKIKTFNPIKDRPNKHAGEKLHGTVRNKDGSTRPASTIGNVISPFGQRFNVWDINPVHNNHKNRSKAHPAPFPIELAQDHIISWSNEGDTVLDPFMGSGTTGVACKNTNRNFIGIELDETYFKIAKERINQGKRMI